jgi:hypothetical protein
MGYLSGPLAGTGEIVSNWNEPNHNPNYVPANVVQHGRLLKDKINTVNETTGQKILVGTAQLWSGIQEEQFTALRELVAAGLSKADYDLIVWHWYMRPKAGAMTLDTTDLLVQEKTFRSILKDQITKVYCSEAGYFTAPKYVGKSNPVTEPQQAMLMVQLIDWYTSRGYYFSAFELSDDPDPTGGNRESWFGFFRTPKLDPASWVNKPVFKAVKDWILAA